MIKIYAIDDQKGVGMQDEIAAQVEQFKQRGGVIEQLPAQKIPKARRIVQDNTAAKFKELPMTFKEWYETRGVQWLIEQYALWANLPADIRLGYGKQSAFASQIARGSVNLPRIGSDIIDFMQGSISAIPRDAERHAFTCYFIKRRPYHVVAKVFGCSESTARSMIMSSVDFIEGRISMYLELKAA